MKYRFLSFLAFILLIFPLSARADHHEVFIHQVVRLNSATCAVELQIEAASQNGFEGVDRIQLDGVTITSIGDTEAAVIDNGGHVNSGDKILFGSNSFEAESGINADVVFDDSNCANFVAGGTFTFVIDDPTFGGPNAVIDTLVAPGGFGENSGAVKSSQGSTPQLVNLLTGDVVVSNNVGSQATIGTSGGNNNGGGGCALTEGNSFSEPGCLAFALALVSLAGYGMLRRSSARS